MVKVLDFGLVKQIERETLELTQTDGITGTPMYMSPESVRDASTVDERSELQRLRRENQELRMEKEILRKATAFVCHERER